VSENKKFEVFTRIIRVVSLGTFDAETAEAAVKKADNSTDWLDLLGFDDEDDPEVYAEEAKA